MTTQTHQPPRANFQAFSVEEFCQAHCISKAFFYKLRKTKDEPQIIKKGRRTLISAEAAANWRNEGAERRQP